MPHFNPRSPCGERPFAPMFRAAMYYFNPRSPCGERRPKTELSPIWTLFQSTLPVRGATGSRAWHWPPDNDFNPRSPCGERQMALSYKGMSQAISIHAPRAGSDGKSAGHHTGPPQFQSTLPVRGATGTSVSPLVNHILFQSTLPVRGATRSGKSGLSMAARFQSTLPVRGATSVNGASSPNDSISIHAPRAGSDGRLTRGKTRTTNFNPRSPCGERPSPGLQRVWSVVISIHAPRAGSDSEDAQNGTVYFEQLS